jgi:hypothetical protein
LRLALRCGRNGGKNLLYISGGEPLAGSWALQATPPPSFCRDATYAFNAIDHRMPQILAGSLFYILGWGGHVEIISGLASDQKQRLNQRIQV